MKIKLKPLVISLSLLGMIHPVFAATSNASDMAAMEAQLNRLEKEVSQLKIQLKKKNQAEATPANNYHVRREMPAQSRTGQAAVPRDPDVPGTGYVSTGPYIGVPYQFSGGDLIVNSPSVDLDLALLTLRKKIDTRYHTYGLHTEEEADHGHLLFSGMVEAQAMYAHPGTGGNNSDIDLTVAELDAYILSPSHWITGLITLGFDNGVTTTNNSRVLNSNITVNKAFITIGNLDKTPFYGTLGQLYVPFGVYSSSMVTNTLTKSLGRTKARTVAVGVRPQTDNTFYGAVYAFKGDSYTQPACGTSSCRINNGGVNLGYRFTTEKVDGRIGGGVIANIADSEGMQDAGFASSPGTNELLIHRVPAYDIQGLISFSKFNVIAEYITASTRFNPTNFSMNAHGAKPKALTLEGSYSFDLWDKPSSFGLGYGQTQDALGINLSKRRYSAIVNTSWWRNTLQALEFRHDNKYSSGDTATGNGVSVGSTSTGKPDNTVTFMFDLFF